MAFGAAHVGAIAAAVMLAAALAALVRRREGTSAPVRFLLAATLVALVAFELSIGAREGWLTWKSFLPLELCDGAMLLAVLTLLRPAQTAAEVLYFWAGSGTLLAMLTPELPWGFPRWEFVVFFGLHGLVLVSAIVVVFGLGLRPRRGAPLRALAATAGWAALAGLANVTLGTNFMYLREKPSVPTPLDWMGPWPVYVVVGAAVAFALFQLLASPFRRDWRQAEA